MRHMLFLLSFVVGLSVLHLAPTQARAAEAQVYKLVLQNQAFEPSEINVPAGQSFILELQNLEPRPVEFESKAMRFEKVVGSGKIVRVTVAPLSRGKYKFVNEFNEKTPPGFVNVE